MYILIKRIKDKILSSNYFAMYTAMKNTNKDSINEDWFFLCHTSFKKKQLSSEIKIPWTVNTMTPPIVPFYVIRYIENNL